MVIVSHGFMAWVEWFRVPSFYLSNKGEVTQTGHFLDNVMANLSFGVDFFFLISGFLITYLLLQEKNSTGKIHIGKFYVRRILRIWPLYFLVVGLAPWWVWYCGEKSPDYIYTVTFTNNFHTIDVGDWQFPFGHFWSVCVEENFYLFWPLFIAIIPVRKLGYFFITVILCSIGFRLYAWGFLDKWNLQGYLNTLSRMDVLAIGSLIAWIHFRKPIVVRISKLAQLVGFALVITGICLLQNRTWDFTASFWVPLGWKYIITGLLFFVFCNNLFNPLTLFRYKKRNFLHYLGKISFGLYMFHNMLFPFIAKKLMYKWETNNFFVFWGVYLFLVILLSTISYELIEKRFLKLKHKFVLVKTGNAI
jgi:peptidoglycan/LPS O-acetylase OafA/YrhL